MRTLARAVKTTLLYDAVLQHYGDLCKYTQIVNKLDKQLVVLALLAVFTYLLSEDGSIKRK